MSQTSLQTASPGSTAQTQRPFNRLWTEKNAALAIFLLPALVLFTVFVMLPMIDAIQFSTYKWGGYGPVEDFVGSRNFENILGNRIFWISVGNSLKVVGISLLVQLPLALVLAILIAERKPSNTVFRMIFFVPFILAEVAAGLIWSFTFDGDYGLVASITSSLGLSPFFILADRDFAFYAIMVVIVWKYFGFHMIIYIAGLQNIPGELIEAATIDGATPFQIVRYIKIPQLRPAITVSVFFSVIGALQLFDMIIPLTNGGPSNLTHTMVTFLYTFGLQRMNIGFGSAVGIILFLFCTIFAFTYRNTVQRGEGKTR
jgi:raffinose/stachyose/melibiose transport system permease protein